MEGPSKAIQIYQISSFTPIFEEKIHVNTLSNYFEEQGKCKNDR